MSRRYFFTLLILLLVLPCRLFAIQKHAVVIAVGRQEDPSWSRIHVDMDLKCVCEILDNYGFTDVVVLKDEEATKQGIVSCLKGLTYRCNSNDVVYIHFSGHGQQMTDIDGDETEDGMDSEFCKYLY